MDPQRFDQLSRTVAGGISRRKFIKLLAGGVAAGLLADWVSFLSGGGRRTAEAMPATTYNLYLPLVAQPCATASSCANKVYCSADQSCRCIRSAEGEIRC